MDEDPNQYGINPNQQVDQNFLGGGNQDYGDENMDEEEPVNANGMFNGNRGNE